MRAFITTLFIAAALAPAAIAAQPRRVFEITYDELPIVVGQQAGQAVCNVAFFGKPPAPATVDKIVRSTLETAVLLQPSRDITAMAFIGDSLMKGNHLYSGPLIYLAKTKRIVTWNEYEEVKTSTQDRGVYYVQTEEHKAYVSGQKGSLYLRLVFPKAPTIQQAYEAAITEAEKASQRNLEVCVWISVGDKATRTSWRPFADRNGCELFVVYDPSTKTIKRGGEPGEVLKKLQF
jgi:hypothetical protein